MAKFIKYRLMHIVNTGTEKEPVTEEVFTNVRIEWNQANEEIAKQEAYNGEYAVEDDGIEKIDSLTIEERVKALEKAAPAPADYESGKWYYRGDAVTFADAVYVCIAPEGVVCTWNPEEYTPYWQKRE